MTNCASREKNQIHLLFQGVADGAKIIITKHDLLEQREQSKTCFSYAES